MNQLASRLGCFVTRKMQTRRYFVTRLSFADKLGGRKIKSVKARFALLRNAETLEEVRELELKWMNGEFRTLFVSSCRDQGEAAVFQPIVRYMVVFSDNSRQVLSEEIIPVTDQIQVTGQSEVKLALELIRGSLKGRSSSAIVQMDEPLTEISPFSRQRYRWYGFEREC